MAGGHVVKLACHAYSYIYIYIQFSTIQKSIVVNND